LIGLLTNKTIGLHIYPGPYNKIHIFSSPAKAFHKWRMVDRITKTVVGRKNITSGKHSGNFDTEKQKTGFRIKN